jgi:large subunit ribosomal protein L18
MATGPRYRVKLSRRRDGKTNYKTRLSLLKSKKPRFVVRVSNKHISCQIIKYEVAGDKTLASAHSRELAELGWGFATSNTPSAYLVGYLCGRETKTNEAVLDIGSLSIVKGSRIFAALKGAVDAGVKIPCDESVFPSEERITGKSIADYNKKANGMPKIFEDVKKKIDAKYKK